MPMVESKSPDIKRKVATPRRGSIPTIDQDKGSITKTKHIPILNGANRRDSITKELPGLKPPPSRPRSSSLGFVSPLQAQMMAKLTPSGSKNNIPDAEGGEYHHICGKQSSEGDGSSSPCQRCLRVQQHPIIRKQNELVFDYVHGEIKHKEKVTAAFGKTLRPANQSNMKKTQPSIKEDEPTQPLETESSTSDDEEPLTADEFLNHCIIDSQTPRLKTANKPQTSETFKQLLAEFRPEEEEKPQVQEIPVIKTAYNRGRRFSLPAVHLSRPM